MARAPHLQEEIMKASWWHCRYGKPATSTLLALLGISASAFGGVSGPSGFEDVSLTVPRAVCGPNDHPETALQGQVPAYLRATGFQGFNCNLQLVGQSKGDGANW